VIRNMPWEWAMRGSNPRHPRCKARDCRAADCRKCLFPALSDGCAISQSARNRTDCIRYRPFLCNQLCNFIFIIASGGGNCIRVLIDRTMQCHRVAHSVDCLSGNCQDDDIVWLELTSIDADLALLRVTRCKCDAF